MATSEAGIIAVNWVEDTSVVILASPLNLTAELVLKPLPCTVSVKLPLPAVTDDGKILPKNGNGLTPVPVTINVCTLEVPPPGPGLETVTLNVPELITSAAVMVAVTRLEETYAVDLALPLKFTVEPGIKLAPSTVNINAILPEAIDDGLMKLTLGNTFATVNVCALEVPPPGPRLITVTANVPAVSTSADGIEAVS